MHFTDTETNNPQVSIFETSYDKELLLDNWKYGSSKAKRALFIIGAIFFFSDLLALSMANALNSSNVVYTLVVPLLYVVLGFFAKAKPLLSMIIASVLFVLILALSIYTFGSKAFVSGWLIKAAVVYFFISGFKHAKEAEESKKKLSSFS